MQTPQRLLLIASPLMRRTPVYDRAAALAKAKGRALHIVAFDYVEGLATPGLVNEPGGNARKLCAAAPRLARSPGATDAPQRCHRDHRSAVGAAPARRDPGAPARTAVRHADQGLRA